MRLLFDFPSFSVPLCLNKVNNVDITDFKDYTPQQSGLPRI